MERIQSSSNERPTPNQKGRTPLLIPLSRQETAIWCTDLANTARHHGFHRNDALFVQVGRFCVYVRGDGHHRLLQPVVLAPKQDLLSLVPIVCPAGQLTYLDAQAITDSVAQDPHVTRLITAIYRFANSSEQVKSRPLPPPAPTAEGIDPELAHNLAARVSEKVERLQDLADQTTRLFSAIYNGVSPGIVLEGPLAEITAAVEDLVGSRMATSTLLSNTALELLSPSGGETLSPDVPEDPLREIWNDVATIRDLVQSRLAASEKQRRISVAAEALQARIIRHVESSLPTSGNGTATDSALLDRFSEAVVAQVNFRRLCEAAREMGKAMPAVLDVAALQAEVESAEVALARRLGPVRARHIREEMAAAVERERAVDRAVDRLLDADTAALAEPLGILQKHLPRILGEEPAERLLSPLRAVLEASPERATPSPLREHCISLLLAVSAHNERRLETLFTAGELSEQEAWQVHQMHSALVGLNIAHSLQSTCDRLQACLADKPVPMADVLAGKQALWGLAYEVLNWVETRKVAASVAENAQPFAPKEGTFSLLRLAGGEALSEAVARATGLTQPLEQSVPLLAETPVLLSAQGELLIPGRSHKLIGGVAETGTFCLSRQSTRWDLDEAAELMACSESPFWIIFHSTLGALYPTPTAITEAVECARRIAQAGGSADVWCGIACHESLESEKAWLHVYQIDAASGDEVLTATQAYESLLAQFERHLQAYWEQMEASLRATGYTYPALLALYQEVATPLKEMLRSFAREHSDALADERWLYRASEEVDAFSHFAVQTLRESQRQAFRTPQNGTRALITALYAIDDQKTRMRHCLVATVRDAACEALLVAKGLLQPATVRLAWDAGQTSATIPTRPEALPEAQWAAFVETYLGTAADDEQKGRLRALCDLAGELFASDEEPGPPSALLLDFLSPVRGALFGRDRGRPLLSAEAFDAFVESLRSHRQELVDYLALRPKESTTADAVMLALLIRSMSCRRAHAQPLWEPVASVLRQAAPFLGHPVADFVHLSDRQEVERLWARLNEGDLQADTRLASRIKDEAERELGVDWSTDLPHGLDLVRDDFLAILQRNLERARQRLLPERDLFLRLASGQIRPEEWRHLKEEGTKGNGQGRRHRRGRRPASPSKPEATSEEDPETLRASLAEAARRCMEYERLATVLAPFTEDTTQPLYRFFLSALAGSPQAMVRPSLAPTPTRIQAAAQPEKPEVRASAPEKSEEPASQADSSEGAARRLGPVERLLAEFDHLGHDELAADLVEAALVLFPSEERVRETLSGSRKQVLDAVLAREFPNLMRSTRMQIVVATEPRGLRLHDISDIAKMASEGGATAADVRALLRAV